MITALALALLSPRHAAGPGIPIHFLAGAKPVSVQISQTWASGCYSVQFFYHVEKPLNEVAKLCGQELFLSASGLRLQGRFGEALQIQPGIRQNISISRQESAWSNTDEHGNSTSGVHVDTFTTVVVVDSPDAKLSPAAWYGPAISATPPAPLIEVPFLPGIHCEAVALTSLEGLISGSGRMFTGRDAAIYETTVALPQQTVQKTLATWGAAHGYVKTQWSSYFKAKAPIFEIQVGPGYPNRSGSTLIRLYTTSKEADRPVARITG